MIMHRMTSLNSSCFWRDDIDGFINISASDREVETKNRRAFSRKGRNQRVVVLRLIATRENVAKTPL